MPREAALEARCCARAKLKGVWPIKLWPTQRGLPDRLLLDRRGRVLFVEFKALRGRVSPAQKVVHTRLKESGFTVIVVRHGWEFDNLLDAWMGQV